MGSLEVLEQRSKWTVKMLENEALVSITKGLRYYNNILIFYSKGLGKLLKRFEEV